MKHSTNGFSDVKCKCVSLSTSKSNIGCDFFKVVNLNCILLCIESKY